MIRLRAVSNRIFLSPKRLIFLHVCSELSSNISSMPHVLLACITILVPVLHDDVQEGPAEEHAHEPAQTRRQLPDIVGEELSLDNDIAIVYRCVRVMDP